MIEIRYAVARYVKAKRRHTKLTQKQLADRLRLAQSTISRIERASNLVSLDVAVRGMIVMGCTDEEIATVFNAGLDPAVRLLRKHAQRRGYPKPSDSDVWVTPAREHRFLRKGREELVRLR